MGPFFTFGLPGGWFAPLPPVSYATDYIGPSGTLQRYFVTDDQTKYVTNGSKTIH